MHWMPSRPGNLAHVLQKCESKRNMEVLETCPEFALGPSAHSVSGQPSELEDPKAALVFFGLALLCFAFLFVL